MPCSSSSKARAGLHVPRLLPGPLYTPRNVSLAGLARRGVFPQNNSTSECFVCDPVVLDRFALVAAAGELATKIGVTGWNQGDAWWAADVCFQAWLKERGGSGSGDLDAAVRQVQAFIQAYGPSRFQPLKEEYNRSGDPVRQHINDRAGYWTDVEGAREYLILPECFRKEVCANCDYKVVAQELIKRGYLLAGNDRRHPYTRQARTADGPNPVWVFWLRSTVWSEKELPAPQDQEESDDF